VFSFAGLLLSGMGEQGGESAVVAHRFLRFYLFRLSDFAVPASLALVTGCILSRWIADRGDFPHQVCSSIFMGCILVAGATMVQENHADGHRSTATGERLASGFRKTRTATLYSSRLINNRLLNGMQDGLRCVAGRMFRRIPERWRSGESGFVCWWNHSASLIWGCSFIRMSRFWRWRIDLEQRIC